MVYEKSLIDDVIAKKREYERFLRSVDAYDVCLNTPGVLHGKEYYSSQCYEQLGLIYRYLGDLEGSRRMFGYSSSIFRHESRTYYWGDEIEGKELAEAASRLWLAGNRGESRKAFDWMIENNVPYTKEQIKKMAYYPYDEQGFRYMWQGYALLGLGRYPEASDRLKEVSPLYKKARNRGGIWQTLEAFLPKALEPLSNYKVNSTEENRQIACDGLEEFITRLTEDSDKFEGYLHYFFLLDAFPEVYRR